MTKRMLIDAGHPEETRVVLLSDNRLEDFDHEARDKKPLKGNIYLAKVTRVEPSLQAAFVEYGGNRHGFLPFSEIHPDYYRLPISDRERLMEEEQAAQRAEEEREPQPQKDSGADEEDDELAQAAAEGAKRRHSQGEKAEEGGETEETAVEQVETANAVETISGDEMDDAVRRRAALAGRYKIQEVIKRRQVILVQVVKEERGNKGAALTTYLSLAGRYCVLMPNTNKGGGISRKIASPQDRKRLKGVLSELNIPEGIAVIVRTAGSNRTKVEIKRDYEYLLRLWDQIRATTLESTAPCLIYEEANLIKRAIRDLYTREMDDVLVEGEEGYKAAKAFMRSLMPSHAKKVQKYEDPKVPLLLRYNVEEQLDNIHNPTVQLKSGGYVVINQTEALVAIDVNSGRATKERHIEETAFKTNLEAADEIAHQLKLRDLAGLVVIDFIDMDAPRNNREVEARLKEAMRQDRARIQLGRISPFGLLELSRQRLRSSLQETSTQVCHTCGGSGFVRSPNSTAMHILRVLEQEGIRNGGGEIQLTLPTAVALYALNDKRERLQDIERRYSFRVRIAIDDHLIPPAYVLDRLSSEPVRQEAAVEAEDAMEVEAFAEVVGADVPEIELEAEAGAEAAAEEQQEAKEGESSAKSRKQRSRRGGRKRRKDEVGETAAGGPAAAEAEAGYATESEADVKAADADEADDGAEAEEAESVSGEADRDAKSDSEEESRAKRRRRRGKRGGRRRAKRPEDEEQEALAAEGASGFDQASHSEETPAAETEAVAAGEPAHEPFGSDAQPEPLVETETETSREPAAPVEAFAQQDEPSPVTAGNEPHESLEAVVVPVSEREDSVSEDVTIQGMATDETSFAEAPAAVQPEQPAEETAGEPEAAEVKPAPRKRRAPAKPRKKKVAAEDAGDETEQPQEAAAEASADEEAKPATAPKKRAARKTTGTAKSSEGKVRTTTTRSRRKAAPTEAVPTETAEDGADETASLVAEQAVVVAATKEEDPADRQDGEQSETAAPAPASEPAFASEPASQAQPEPEPEPERAADTSANAPVSESGGAAEPRGVDDLATAERSERQDDASDDENAPRRRGWWKRLSG